MKWMESFTLNTKDFNQAFCNLFQLGHSFLSPENEMLLRATSFDGFHSQASQVTFHKLLHHLICHHSSPPAKWSFSATAFHPGKVPESKARCAGSASISHLTRWCRWREADSLWYCWEPEEGLWVTEVTPQLSPSLFCLPQALFPGGRTKPGGHTHVWCPAVTQNKGACV